MSISFLKPNRTVLLVGDDALYIYKVTTRSAVLVDDIPWITDGFADVVAALLKKECGSRPVLIVNDMTDQHFKGGQRLPKVGVMDKQNVLRRKIQVAFPNYPIRGALPIVAPKGQAKISNLYLFAAVPMSEQVAKTIEAVKISLLPVVGFVLLPVEASSMVAAFSKKMAPPNGGPARWTILIGQHQNGALRQVITRDGQLAMTRMTPVTDVEKNPAGWATDVVQEFRATISYLTRFGFSQEDGADVIVIGNTQHAADIEQGLDINCHFKAFTPSEAARLIGCSIGLQKKSYYADSLHAAWIGRKSKFSLPMQAVALDRIHKPRQVAAGVMALLLVGGAYMAWDLTIKYQELSETQSGISLQQTAMVGAEREYRQEVARMEALGYDIERIQETIEVFDMLEEQDIKPLTFMQRIGTALEGAMRLDQLSLMSTYVPPQDDQMLYYEESSGNQPGNSELYLTLSFPPTIEPERGIQEVNELYRRLLETFPGMTIEVVRQVARPEYTRDLVGVAGETAHKQDNTDEYVAEFVIKGRLE